MTEPVQAIDYCHGLHDRLVAALLDVDYVRSNVAAIEHLAPGFPETLFCKRLLLPLIDRWTNEFLRKHFGASENAVFSAMRCEGFSDLSKYYSKDGLQTHYSATTQTKTKQVVGKNG